ncbi:heat shock 70 kDa protein 16 [Tripterygium wilfordii]|uniref:Heat shock 70 kDa protein 16 n=1 Tax=Tripterygium wilfordii TaxID=458696 RepID=A0A7J7C8S3_TRIWF|nr:heat shock 70 kDa protein 16-like [Tripterygium wilfordii]XP_038686226.1 heat shock 70 kDa protein 16-like [Tripterygium wilfordii]XP_038686227.1 heat shock 70 kDa protein 16-like [Tripterygium wilfordii]KAF5730551.1 heat shock 70 kDa protein 16 [Tripterygium wilfordii]
MSVVGLDIGNENCVIAVVKQRGIDVLLNEESQRETPSVVCFGEKQRFLGSAGAASASMNPKSTVSGLKRLIGRNFKDPDVQNELKMLPFETSEGPDGGILIHLKYLGKAQVFTPVQILGMLFAHVKEIAEKNLEAPVVDCVIGIPSYLTDLQRRAYLHAAAIAGLKPLRLMHDCTATALSYGIYKTDFSNAGPTNVAFVDIGQCDTQVCIASFIAGHMRILSHAFDASLGGRDFDEVLFRYFVAQFKEQYNIDVYSNVRACVRLRAACEKLKKVLSANAEAPLNIECLMDEKDVKGFIKREEFEKLASGLLERISIPCNKALAEARLTVEKIHSVELVGSGSRIPAITKLLTSLFKRGPGRTLNASECVARGCALQCAMLSPVFRVREYEVQDSIPFSIGISSDDAPVCKGPDGILFPRGQPFPSVKILTFQRSGLLHLEVFYGNPNELSSGISQKISRFTIGPFQSHSEKTRTKVKVQLNLHGIVDVESATLIEGHADDSVGRENANARMHKMEAESASDDSSMIVENANEDNASMQSKLSQGPPANIIKEQTPGRLELPISENIYGGMTKAELAEAREKERLLAQQDQAMEQTKDKRNSLESYVYETRNKLLNTLRSFASDREREGISRSLQETEDWLYDDGDDETENAYTSKLEDLKKLVDPIETRYKDEEGRAQATKYLLNCIVDYRMCVDSFPANDRELIVTECNKAEQWLREKSQQQDLLPKNTDPVLWSSEIKSRAEELNRTCKHILQDNASRPNTEDKKGSDHQE